MGASFLLAALVFLGSSSAVGRSNYSPGLQAMIAPVYRPGQPILLNPSAGVCFTLRTYKVKPTEEWQDAFNGEAQKYSTCQMGSDYRLRNAVTPASK